ncbi:hypothetical protein BB561_001263 [Smittium simulii]|uniref:Peptidase S1 domain-containing protein n=1 Tax=Smittium simulii TaxID=133385 RepID=A0A2T9YVC2_9FUNG|nr:hypothetical protein BB561_001263 [Smittium simulii]
MIFTISKILFFLPLIASSKNLTTTTGNSTTARVLNVRIINGSDAYIKDFPYIAQIIRLSNKSNFCGGSLISDKTVLTAAHCLREDIGKNFPIGDIKLYFGTDKNAVDYPNTPYDVEKVTFFDTHIEKDIALIQLKKAVPKEVATPIQIYNGNINESMDFMIAGFGAVSLTTHKPSDYLMKAKVDLSSSNYCKRNNINWVNNNNEVICTEANKDISVCFGDSGGPLIAKINGKHVLIGVIEGNKSTLNPPGPSCGKNTVTYYMRAKYFV